MDPRRRGQALVEFALVFPIFMLLLFAIIVFGLGVFYQQQIANAAREGARFASVNSAEARCPVVSRDPFLNTPPFSYFACDTPAAGWPKMTAAAKSVLWGMDVSAVSVSACWSSYHDPADPSRYDQPPVDPITNAPNTLDPLCTYAKAGTNPASLPCPAAATSAADDEGTSLPDNVVTVYACYRWRPPFAGMLLIPSEIALRAVASEAIHSQQ